LGTTANTTSKPTQKTDMTKSRSSENLETQKLLLTFFAPKQTRIALVIQSSTLCCCRSTDLEFANWQSSWPRTKPEHF